MKKISAARCGQNKNKKLFFVFRLSLLLPIFLLAVFCWGGISIADDLNNKLSFSEILPKGNSASEEFVELHNLTNSEINLKTLPLKLHVVSSTNSDSSKTLNFIHETIPAKGYFLISSKDYADNNPLMSVGATYSTSGNSLVSNGAAYISTSGNKKENILDFLGFGTSAYFETNIIVNPTDKKSVERDGFDTNSWHESCIDGGTPGQENSKEEDCKSNDNDNSSEDNATGDPPKKSDYIGQVTINEIYPAPITAAGEKEFVEIKNTSSIDLDFSKWCLKDETENNKGESGSCKKIDDLKKTSDFSVFYGTFSLNNDSKGDTVFLYDSNANLVDTRSYASPKSGYSYAFDESAWRWTSHPTPGAENVFDKKLSGKILRDDHVYKNIYTNFEIKADRDAQKFTWDFGDGHKSYLEKTKHKYLKNDTFHASLQVRGNGEDALYEFDVEVEKYTAPKIRITQMSPNPKGSDTDNEWIEIKNNSKKQTNLKGWSVATGWDNMYNHPIREDFTIKAGKAKKLSRDICAFTLANTKTKLELRDPSGKAVQKIEYDNGKKSIQEDALYQKETNSEWEWSKTAATVGANIVSAQSTQVTEKSAPTETPPPVPMIPTEDLGKYSVDPAWQKKRDYKIELANFNSKIKIPQTTLQNQPLVLGARIIPIQEHYYTFTKIIPQKHWAILLYENLWLEINSKLNRILNEI